MAENSDLYTLGANYGLVPEGMALPGQGLQQPGIVAVGLPPAAPVAKAAPAAIPIGASGNMGTMLQMLERLDQEAMGKSPYAEDYKAARTQSAAETANFQRLIEEAMKTQGQAGPSKAEMYFQLAAAFGAPTKTGHFMESLGNAGQVMSSQEKLRREAENANLLRRQQLGLTGAQARLTAAKESEGSARQAMLSEAQSKRAIISELIKDYIKSGQPQSEAGKVALDSGLKPGTPEYTAFVEDYIKKKLESGDMYKAIMAGVAQTNVGLAQQRLDLAQAAEQRKIEADKKLTPAEMKLKTETEDTISQLEQSALDLQKAFKLNPNTFSGSLVDRGQYKVLSAAGSKDPKVVNTGELYNLLGQSALGKLRAIFGGNPTEGERAILLDLEGIDSKSIEEREKIIKRSYKAAQERIKKSRARLADINAGKYRDTSRPADQLPESLGEEPTQ